MKPVDHASRTPTRRLPCRRTAAIAYTEHVGSKRHAAPKSTVKAGDTNQR